MTGRKRPPAPFTVAKAGGDKDSLPHASTCASSLFLPEYSSAAVAKDKLRSVKYCSKTRQFGLQTGKTRHKIQSTLSLRTPDNTDSS